MHLILDTHALVWFLQKDKRIPVTLANIITRDEHAKIIPFIVMCEIHYLNARGRFPVSSTEVVEMIGSVHGFEIHPQGEELLPHLHPELEIHDALIVATAVLCRERFDNVKLVSKDSEIHRHSPVPVLWK